MKQIDELLNECKYMPVEFRDFHDQKDLFKLIFSKIQIPDELSHVSWVDAHIYTIDVFLWFMAKRGYTLQRARHNIEFIDIQEELGQENKERMEQFAEMIAKQTTDQDQIS